MNGERVLVCGSRDFTDRALVFEILDEILPSYVIEGGARGADTFGREWAEARGVPFKTYPADWDTHKRAAGPIRNRQMLSEGRPSRVVAFVSKPLEQSRGTFDMVKIS